MTVEFDTFPYFWGADFDTFPYFLTVDFDTFPYYCAADFDTFPDADRSAVGKINAARAISQAALDFCPRALIDSIVPARNGRVLSRVGVESWLHDPDANRPRGTVALPTSMKGFRMDNFSVRSERNFHNLIVKPKRMHLLDKPNGYVSAMVKSSLSHQMRFTVQMLEEELCAAGNPHVLQIKLSGDDSREPSSWKLFADGACIADGSGDFARACFCEGAEVFLDLSEMRWMPPTYPSGARGTTSC